MKTLTPTLFKFALAAIVALGFYAGSASTAQAHDGGWDARHHYYRDNYGYWDEHDHYRHFITWRQHRGYWDNRGGVRVFINVD